MQVIDLWIISLIDSQRSIPEHVKTACSRCKYDRVCHVFFLTGRANPHIAQILCSANESGDVRIDDSHSASIADSSERTVFHAKGCSLTLRRFPRCLVLLVRPLPPVRHVAAVAAVELLGNVVVTSWAATPFVRFGCCRVSLSTVAMN